MPSYLLFPLLFDIFVRGFFRRFFLVRLHSFSSLFHERSLLFLYSLFLLLSFSSSFLPFSCLFTLMPSSSLPIFLFWLILPMILHSPFFFFLPSLFFSSFMCLGVLFILLRLFSLPCLVISFLFYLFSFRLSYLLSFPYFFFYGAEFEFLHYLGLPHYLGLKPVAQW